MENKIVKGDDTNAFGGKLLLIDIEVPEGEEYIITKAIFKCGCIRKTFENPVFPIEVNLSSDETKQLNPSNNCYLAVFDENGLKQTCEGTLRIEALNEVV
jgi:hypothetical protein